MKEIVIALIEMSEEIVKKDLIDLKEVEEILQDLIVTAMKEVIVVILEEIVIVRELKDLIVIVKDQMLLLDKVVQEEVMEVRQEEVLSSMIKKLLSLQWLRDQKSNINKKADPLC